MPAPPSIAVLDLGTGNLRSVAKALERAGVAPEVSSDPSAVRRADGLVLPGVGNFASAAGALREKGLDEALREAIAAGVPYLGICLGLQLLFEESDEHGRSPGLGILPGRVERLPSQRRGAVLRVPHIGWNEVRWRSGHALLERLPPTAHYYFVHAFRAVPADQACVVGWTRYGVDFASAVATERLFAVQFHPEKSQHAGFALLEAYAGWVTSCGS